MDGRIDPPVECGHRTQSTRVPPPHGEHAATGPLATRDSGGRTAIKPLVVMSIIAVLVAAMYMVGPPIRRVTSAPAPPLQDDPLVAVVYLPLALQQVSLEDLEPPATAPTTPGPAPTEPSPDPTELSEPTLEPTPTPGVPPYEEPLTDFPSIDDLRADYDPERWYETMLAVLERRYGTGHHIVVTLEDSRTNAELWTTGQRGSFDQLLGALQLAVHEMDHQLGFQEGIGATFFREYAFVVRADEMRLVENIDTFPRSEIADYITGSLENFYKSTYLEGDSGNQNFSTLLDEFNAYTHSLFVGFGINDQLRGRTSYRDGLVTMMLYVEFFLRHGREHHPDDYAALQGDEGMRSLVDLLWRRADFILGVTEEIGTLSLDPDAVEAKMMEPDMRDEVARFVEGH